MCVNTANSDKMKLLQEQQNLDVESVCNWKEQLNTESNEPCSLTVSGDFYVNSNDTCNFDIKNSVRFSDSNNTVKIIESRHTMSNKEIRKYWWTGDETTDMKPGYDDLKRLHQNCGTNGCIRGLESYYWKKKTMKEKDFRPDNENFAIFVKEFLRPSTSFIKHKNDNNNNDDDNTKDRKNYRNHVISCQNRARVLALMDEAYVMEHVYGLPCSHLDIVKDDKWDYLRCCSCHKRTSSSTRSSSSSFNQDSSYIGKFVQGVRRRVSGKGRKIHSHTN